MVEANVQPQEVDEHDIGQDVLDGVINQAQ